MNPISLDDLLDSLTSKALDGRWPSRDELLAVLRTSDEDTFEVVAAASRVRRPYPVSFTNSRARATCRRAAARSPWSRQRRAHSRCASHYE